jgi:methylmalonyl-CoA/ethylmalonyl-CoA epimerase
MKQPPLAFHHLGLLTGQPDLARSHLRQLGYQCGAAVYDPLQDVELCMCSGAAGAPAIELVTPRATNVGLSRLLKRKDDYAYHVCLVTPRLELGLRSLAPDEQHRIVEMAPPKPAVLFDGARVAFYAVPGLGLVELLERTSE